MAAAGHNGGERREGIDIGTLAVAAIAAAAAAVVTSKLWPGATIISTAMTPVIVALVKEWLRRPAERISAVTAKAPEVAARVVGSPRQPVSGDRAAPADSRASSLADAAPSVPTREGRKAVLPPAGSPAAGTPAEEMFVEPAPADAPSRYRLYRRRGAHWRLAVITGLVAFMVAVLVITLPELVLGGAVGGKGGTTVFGGGAGHSSQTKDDGAGKSGAKRSRDGSSTSEGQQKQAPAKSSSQPAPQTNGSSSSKQAPSSSSSPTQSTPSAPSTSPGTPGAPGSAGSGGSPSGGQ